MPSESLNRAIGIAFFASTMLSFQLPVLSDEVGIGPIGMTDPESVRLAVGILSLSGLEAEVRGVISISGVKPFREGRFVLV